MEAVLKTSSNARAESRSDGLSRKAEYRRLCDTEPSIPLFSTDWWLDAAAGPENWDVVLVKNGGTIAGAMPFVTARRFGLDLIRQPPLTPVLGPWIRPSGETASARLSNEQKIMQSLIEQLPRFDLFRQTWNRSLSNWLPFYWNGFSQTTEYTYVIPALHDLDALWSELDVSRRKHCKSGIERHKLRVREDLTVDAFLALHKMTLDKRGVTQSFSDECLRRIDAACVRRKRRKILIAVDEAGRHCAGTYTVWDGSSAYALIKGANPDMHHTRAPSVCQWESIRFGATVAPQYDFLGNMNPSIEPYVRSFATRQIPVFTISKIPSRLLRLRQGLMSALASGR